MAITSIVVQRRAAMLTLLVLGIFSLPVTAYFFDEPGTENWILPTALAVMAGLGAVVGSLLSGLASRRADQARLAWANAADCAIRHHLRSVRRADLSG